MKTTGLALATLTFAGLLSSGCSAPAPGEAPDERGEPAASLAQAQAAQAPGRPLALVYLGAASCSAEGGGCSQAWAKMFASCQPGFDVEYVPPAGFSNVVVLVGLIPGSAYVLASSDLFPLVANDLNAYALLWTPQAPGQLPFGPGHLSMYVLLATDQAYAAPPWLVGALIHHEYGLRATVGISPVGTVYLWELEYTGPTRAIGPP